MMRLYKHFETNTLVLHLTGVALSTLQAIPASSLSRPAQRTSDALFEGSQPVHREVQTASLLST